MLPESHPSFLIGQQPFPAHSVLWWTKLRIWSKLKLIEEKKSSFSSDWFPDLVQWAAAQTFLQAQGRKQSRVRISCQVEKEVRTAARGTVLADKVLETATWGVFIFPFFHQNQIFIFCSWLILVFQRKGCSRERTAAWIFTFKYFKSISHICFFKINKKVY